MRSEDSSAATILLLSLRPWKLRLDGRDVCVSVPVVSERMCETCTVSQRNV